MKKRAGSLISGFLIILLACLLVGTLGAPEVFAAPSGQVNVEEDNVLLLGESQEVTVTFKNTASAVPTDVASTIQFITLAAANLNPSRTAINLTAGWEIWESESAPGARASGTVVSASPSSEIYAPYSTSDPVDLYTWALGKPDGVNNLPVYKNNAEFTSDNTLRILRPGELIKLTVTVECQNIVGDSRIWFFFRATEFVPTSLPIEEIGTILPESLRMNLYYSKVGSDQTPYWWPVHNSYDPYDTDILTGHNFDQHSWTRGATIRAFAKSSKLVHQKPVENPPEEYSFHICGVKFLDRNGDGEYDAETEPGMNGVTVVLLGPDGETKAEDWYAGKFSYPSNEDNPLETGENELMGSYCFNLEDVEPGSYIFYIREEVPSGYVSTTPTLIGPITLEARDTGPRENLNNHFGNAKPQVQIGEPPSGRGPAVGGKVYPREYASYLGTLAYFSCSYHSWGCIPDVPQDSLRLER